MFKQLYYCSECKKIISKVEDLFFVEDGTPRGFCSEVCIEKYYSEIVKHFEKEVEKKKKDLGIDENLEQHEEAFLVDELLKEPDEIWRVENQLKEEFFIFIKENKELKSWLIASCFIFNFRPSFILSLDSTKSKELVDSFRYGEKVEDLSPYKQGENDNVLEQEVLDDIEQKKSSVLAELLENRLETDIPFESFPLYEEYFDLTLYNPDEMYMKEDEEGDEIVACIKAHEKEGVSFYYFVLCIHVGDKVDNVDPNAIFPILGFPSVDGNIYKKYQSGKRLSGQLKN